MKKHSLSLMCCVVVAVGACSFDLAVPDGVVVRCAENVDCPEGFACARTGLCVDAARIADDAIAFDAAPALSADVLSCADGHNAATLTFALSVAPTAVVVNVDDIAVDCDASGLAFSCALAPELLGACGDDDDASAEGVHTVAVVASDDLGNEVRDNVALTLDLTAPALLAGSVAVTLFPSEENPRRSFVVLQGGALTAATDGTLAVIGFGLDEAATILDVRLGPQSIVNEADAEDTVDVVALQLQRVVNEAYPEGALALAADVIDDAGNAATLDLGAAIVVDRTAPAPAPAGALTLRRFPWGDAVAEDAHVDVDGVAVTDEADAIVNVILGSGSVVQGVVDGAGAFAVSVAGDSESARVVVVDAAGNVSTATPVDAVEWQATMHKKVVGSVFENPHVMTEVPRFGAFLTTPLDREVRAPGRAAFDDDNDVVGGTGVTLDAQTFANAEPRIRRNSLLARDPRTGRVLFTGGTFQTGIDDTAVYAVDDFGHIAVVGQSNRPTRRDSAFALDLRRGVFVSFGGATGSATLNETFESEDGITWRERAFDTAPPPRTFAAATYDADRAVIVLFGGQNGAAFLDDTWLYDGASWTQLDAEPRPSPRSSTAMAHLPGVGVVLFGGLTEAGADGETWLLRDTAWELVRPSATPSPRVGAAFAYDVDAAALLLFGGDTDAGGTAFGSAVNETWHFDGARYVQRNPRTSPSGRFHTSLATDVAGGRVFLVGGEFDQPQIGAGFGGENDVWQWNGNNWSERVAHTPPPAVEARGAAFDPARNHVVLFGGLLAGGAVAIINSTHTYNGTTTSQLSPAFVMPGTDDAALAAFRGNVIAIGVADAATHSWNGTNWSVVAGDPPNRSDRPRVVNDDANDRLVAVANGRTFTYDGAAWTQRCQRGVGGVPCPAAAAQVAFDRGRNQVMAYDGTEMLAWTGSAWTVDDVTVPPLVAGAGDLVFDEERGALLLVRLSQEGTADLHRYADGVFTPLPLKNEVGARTAASVVYDSARGRVVVIGGHSAETNASTAEVLVLSDDASPAHVFATSFAAAGAPRRSGITSVRLDLRASAEDSDGGDADVDVFVWHNGAWAAVEAVVDDDGLHVDVDPALLATLPFGAREDLIFAWTPRRVGARIHTNQVLVTVDYLR